VPECANWPLYRAEHEHVVLSRLGLLLRRLNFEIVTFEEGFLEMEDSASLARIDASLAQMETDIARCVTRLYCFESE